MTDLKNKILLIIFFFSLSITAVNAGNDVGFDVDLSPQPSNHPDISPENNSEAALNPPSFIWRFDKTASSYILEFSQDEKFKDGIKVEDIDMPFYNHYESLEQGKWYWRYFVVRSDGKVSNPSPTREFIITLQSVVFPVPSAKRILADMPHHPRIFTTPEQLPEFRARRESQAKQAWEEIRSKANTALRREIPKPKLVNAAENPPQGPTRRMEGRWKPGQPVRRQVFFVCEDEVKYAPDYGDRDLASAASRAYDLALAYLISGETHYAETSKQWLLFTATGRVDYHLPLELRASHDTVVYAYEVGLKSAAIAYDWIYDYLDEEEREQVLDHIKFHAEAAYRWIRDGIQIHLTYQESHAQQCMHALLPTVLAVAGDLPEADEWVDYLVRQYANRIAWTSDDGGYFEGQTYAHKFRWILESLVAMRTATSIDVFQQPRIKNSGNFWLYCMALNYWFHHGGDNYSLLWHWGNPADAYISNLLASMTADPYVKWWSDTVYTDPTHIPLQYLSQTDLKAKPPVDIAQAKVFPQTGQLAAYDKFYDHLSDRLFFRSSPWGAHSHAHPDQNNFVIHAGGEILAADVGYYTYYNDAYDSNWSKTTNTHNTILINGEGQPKSIESKGLITDFFHTPDYTFFIGDASEAYQEPMKKFKRAMLFIRPNMYVVYDELEASSPSRFSWLLNTFDRPEIDRTNQLMVVPQQNMRLQVEHLLPKSLTYYSSNKRRYPIKDPTRAWSRYTEAFPEPWHTRVNTGQLTDTRILTLMHTYDANYGSRVVADETIENATTVGMVVKDNSAQELIIFRRSFSDVDEIRASGFVSDAKAVSVSYETDVNRFFFSDGAFVSRDDWCVKLPGKGSIYGSYNKAAAGAIFWIDCAYNGVAELPYSKKPTSVLYAPLHKPNEAKEIDYQWNKGKLLINWHGINQAAIWVDSVVDIRKQPPAVVLKIENSLGKISHQLKTDITEDGDWIAYGQISPSQSGTYKFDSSVSGRWLIQDRWTPVKTARGERSIQADWREGAEIFFRFAPTDFEPVLSAKLTKETSNDIINFLRNGSFEEGIPNYPPRGWVVNPTKPGAYQGSQSGTGGENPREWAHWSQEQPRSGSSVLKVVRPKYNIEVESQPMRLLSEGRYKLRFWAKGDAIDASVVIKNASSKRLTIEPSEQWKEYELETNLEPGLYQVVVQLREGGKDNQILWVDDMEFGPAN